MRIQMELSRILICEHTGAQIIELRELNPLDGQARWFPIVIGTTEAEAISDAVTEKLHSRPRTHSLFTSTIDALGASLISITVTHLQQGTFYASLDLVDQTGQSVEVDARPSDAIALAAIEQSDIYVEDAVLQAASPGVVDDHDQ